MIRDIEVRLLLSDEEAASFSQILKRLRVRDLGREGVNLATDREIPGAERAIRIVGAALSEAGYAPR
jgi:hypothetical protein